jgi:thymidylate synthase
MNSLDNDYQKLLRRVLAVGVNKTDRTGTGTKSIFGSSIRHDMSEGFPILTTKKVAFKTMVTELKWFLRGDTNIKYLQDNNCKIWDGDYEKSGRTDGDLGPIYGKQWRDINGIDQLENLITGIISNPDGRRHLVDSWNVEDLDKMTLPPCHYSFQCYVADGKLSLMWNQRSADLFLGVPFNISSYGLLLLLLCKETRLEPGELIGNFGDVHLYSNHLDQAEEQIGRYSYDLPEAKLSCYDIYRGDFDVELINYESHPIIKASLSN